MTNDTRPEGAQDEAPELALARRLDEIAEANEDGYAMAGAMVIRRLYARVQELERELVVEAGRAAQLRLTVSNLDHQHAMQAAMNSEARNELAAIRARGAQGESNG